MTVNRALLTAAIGTLLGGTVLGFGRSSLRLLGVVWASAARQGQGMKAFAFLALAVLGGGCASITKGTSDVVNVEIANCGETVDCTASNKKGSWDFKAPGSVRIKKSDDALRITCEDGDGTVSRSVMPQGDAMIWGNVLVGGIIGAGVDSNTDANQELPDSITLHRQTCRGKPLDGGVSNK